MYSALHRECLTFLLVSQGVCIPRNYQKYRGQTTVLGTMFLGNAPLCAEPQGCDHRALWTHQLPWVFPMSPDSVYVSW